MHSNPIFSVHQILWTLNFAGELILLVVLLGRDRIRRFPFFTTGIVLFAFRLLAEELLADRVPLIGYQTTILALGDLAAVVGLLVLVELGRRAFEGMKRSVWLVNGVGMLLVAAGVLAVMAPWPARADLDCSTTLGRLKLMQLVALKGDTLVSLLTIELGLLIVVFGSNFKAGWRSHVQQIVIGLSTVAITLLTIQISLQSISAAARLHPPDQVQYQHLVALLGKLGNASRLLYISVLVWWIYWLWADEPGTPANSAAEPVEEPEAAEE